MRTRTDEEEKKMACRHGHDECQGDGFEGDDGFFRLHLQIEANIAAHGQHLLGVMDGGEPFLYTIGNHARGLPELLAVGVDPSVFAGVLNHLGRMQRARGRAFEDGEILDLGGRFPVKAVMCGPAGIEDYAIQAGVHYGEGVEVAQILVPDEEGRFPDEEGCREPYASQPILRGIPAGFRR